MYHVVSLCTLFFFFGIFALPDEDFLKGCFIAFFHMECMSCLHVYYNDYVILVIFITIISFHGESCCSHVIYICLEGYFWQQTCSFAVLWGGN